MFIHWNNRRIEIKFYFHRFCYNKGFFLFSHGNALKINKKTRGGHKCLFLVPNGTKRCQTFVLATITYFHYLSPILIFDYYFLFLVWTWMSFKTTTRVFSSFVVATAAGQFDLYISWHFQNTSILFSASLKNRHWSMSSIRSPLFDIVNSTFRSFLPENHFIRIVSVLVN